MTLQHFRRMMALCVSTLAISGCGGGGSGMSFIPAPPPAPTPSPTPTPTPAGPIAPDHLGLVSSQPFAVLAEGDTYSAPESSEQNAKRISGPSAQDVQFSYDGASNSYQISIPGFHAGTLTNTSYNGSSGQPAGGSFSQVSEGSSTALQPLYVTLPTPGSEWSPYSYTSYASWSGKTGIAANGDTIFQEGYLAYGIPTLAGDVPITGSATYSAQVMGSIGANFFVPVSGTADLSFDFGAGKLTGSMHAGIFDYFDGFVMDFGKYEFTQTNYSTGSTTFSGKFVVPGAPNADSSFSGMFTGPAAAELMARFEAPYVHDGQQGTMSGIWVGKKN
jgi:hypothetical protein